jgi:hypothetical protein
LQETALPSGVANLSFGEADGACVLPDCRWRLADIDRSDCDRTHTKRIAFNRAHLIGNTCGRQPPVRMRAIENDCLRSEVSSRLWQAFFTTGTDRGAAMQGGGAGGIRTLDRALQPYNGLANRRLQPLGHSSIGADMPDIGASRKPEIVDRLIREGLAVPVSGVERDLRAFWATAFRNIDLRAARSPSLCCVCRKLQ